MIRSGLVQFGFFGKVLSAGLAMPLLLASSALAQEVSPTPTSEAVTYNENGTVINRTEASTERVIVTGSNIPTAQEVGPNPVLNINRDLINKSGEQTVEELLRLPMRMAFRSRTTRTAPTRPWVPPRSLCAVLMGERLLSSWMAVESRHTRWVTPAALCESCSLI